MFRPAYLALCLLLAGCAAPPAPLPASHENRLGTAIAHRLSFAREVAWIKYRDHLPVRDPRREAEVLDRVTTLAESHGLDPARARAFFAAQIAASCAEQEFLIHRWSRGAALPTFPPRSLAGDVRRDIDAANVALVDAMVTAAPTSNASRSALAHDLRRRGFSRRAADLAAAVP